MLDSGELMLEVAQLPMQRLPDPGAMMRRCVHEVTPNLAELGSDHGYGSASAGVLAGGGHGWLCGARCGLGRGGGLMGHEAMVPEE